MSFKIFYDNQMLSFEKFYLKNRLYLADSMEYETLGIDNDKSFYTDSSYKRAREEDIYHYIRVREFVLTAESKAKFREKAAVLEDQGFFKNESSLTSLFDYPKNFFRNSGFRSKKFDDVIGESFFNGRRINRKIIYMLILEIYIL